MKRFATKANVCSLRRALESQGFLHLKGVLDRKMIDSTKARAALELHKLDIEVRDTRGQLTVDSNDLKFTGKETIKFGKRLVRSAEYQALKASPGVRSVVNSIFGPKWKFYEKNHSSWTRVSIPSVVPGPMSTHQDSIYLGPDRSLFVIWIPLHDCPKRQGGVGVVPASHKNGIYKHYGKKGIPVSADDDHWRAFSFKQGDVFIFHYNLIHGSTPNLTPNRVRVSVDFRIKPKVDWL
jgi:ectoine hydroxylase-related dioxygenase (phytanoyl-CoA dioxygenase family)